MAPNPGLLPGETPQEGKGLSPRVDRGAAHLSDRRLEKVEGSGLQGARLLPESLCDPHAGKEVRLCSCLSLGSGVSVAGKCTLTLISLRLVRKQGRQAKPKPDCAPEIHEPASVGSTFSKQKSESVSHSVVSDSETPWTVAHQAPPSAFPSKNTEVGFHFLLRGIFPTQDQTQISCIAGRFFTI